jgi:hypothetical protein
MQKKHNIMVSSLDISDADAVRCCLLAFACGINLLLAAAAAAAASAHGAGPCAVSRQRTVRPATASTLFGKHRLGSLVLCGCMYEAMVQNDGWATRRLSF